jgi:hypothetical protein
MQSSFSINGVAIKRPSKFQIERYKITKSERLANGDMSMDLIAKKRKFILEYDVIEAAELNKILNLIWEADDVFYDFSYVESNTVKTAVVYTGSIPSNLYRTDTSNWIWTNVSVHLIQR